MVTCWRSRHPSILLRRPPGIFLSSSQSFIHHLEVPQLVNLGVVMEEKPLVGSLTSLSFANIAKSTPFPNVEWALQVRSKLWIPSKSIVFSGPCEHSPSHLSYGLTDSGGGCFLNVALSCSRLLNHHGMFHPEMGVLLRMTSLSTEHMILLVTVNSQNMRWSWFSVSSFIPWYLQWALNQVIKDHNN